MKAKLNKCWKVVMGGALISGCYLTLLLSTNSNPQTNVVINSPSTNKNNLGDPQEAPISEFFTGDKLSGNLYYIEDNDDISLWGIPGEGSLTTSYICSGTNVKLIASTFNGKPITSLEFFPGDVTISGIEYHGLDLHGTVDLSESTNLKHLGYQISSIDGFLGLSDITNVILPPSIECIANYAFTGCTKLTSIAFYNEDPSWMKWDAANYTGIAPTFISAHTDSDPILSACPLNTIYVPDDKVSEYAAYAAINCTDWYDSSKITFKGLSEMPTPTTNNNLGLILGLSLGLGIPVLAGATAGIVVGVKKHQNKGKKK